MVAKADHVVIHRLKGVRHTIVLQDMSVVDLSVIISGRIRIAYRLPTLGVTSRRIRHIEVNERAASARAFLQFFKGQAFVSVRRVLQPRANIQAVNERRLMQSYGLFTSDRATFNSHVANTFQFGVRPRRMPAHLFVRGRL